MSGEVQPVLAVRGLRVAFGAREVVHGLDLDVMPRECIGIVGESGSGKSLTARALVGMAPRDASIHVDRLDVLGADASRWSSRAWRSARGRKIGFVLQDALQSLDPLRTVGAEVDDALRVHTSFSRAQREARVRECLERAGMPEPAVRMRQRPGELSGGLQQRALIASAIVCDPPLLIADEPTTALDATVQAQVLAQLRELVRAGTALVLISHDLDVVAHIADRVLVMRAGEVVEHGPTASVLTHPRTEYTATLLRARPGESPRSVRLLEREETQTALAHTAPLATVTSTEAEPQRTRAPEQAPVLLSARDLSVSYRRARGERFVALNHVSVDVPSATTVGIVGESGSGKTTLARVLWGAVTPESGEVRIRGEQWSGARERDRRTLRPTIGAVFQDALGSFDPRWTVGRILKDAVVRAALDASESGNRQFDHDRLLELLDDVNLDAALLGRRPRTLSGGERQRVAIARALAARPAVLICDEPVSALDVTVQAQILDLFDRLQERHGMSYVFISHDIAVIRHMADQVVVMHDGRVVESGEATGVLTAPKDAYTRGLLAASRLG